MSGIEELLSNKQVAFKQHLLKVLLKEELITQPVYYKALELLKEEEKSNGIAKQVHKFTD